VEESEISMKNIREGHLNSSQLNKDLDILSTYDGRKRINTSHHSNLNVTSKSLTRMNSHRSMRS